jgi:hypothetical protein
MKQSIQILIARVPERAALTVSIFLSALLTPGNFFVLPLTGWHPENRIKNEGVRSAGHGIGTMLGAL